MGKNRILVGGIAATLILAIGGYWGYSALKKREQQQAITAAVKDTTARLRETLVVQPNASGKGALPKVDANLRAVEAHLDTVRKASASRSHAELADGAEHYVLGAREIMRRQVTSIRLSEQSTASRHALAAHMSRAAYRDANWIHEAMNRKKKVEGDYFDYNVTLLALSEVLWTFPDARKRLVSRVDDSLLLEIGPAEDARRAVLSQSKRIAQELDGVRRLAPDR
ncbi:MAG: hypothetical protein M3544_13130 [Pseudomonadota bacterium]|nr:hypothetical protein [Pseudomonadota bacterium]